MKSYKLNDNLSIPALGFGTWQLEDAKTCIEAVNIALEVGYRHIDTADAYHNHKFIKKALEKSSLKREELFITSKLWRGNYHKNDAIEAGKRALEELGIPYLDLFLIHWPDRTVSLMETLDALMTLKSDGLIKEWGVSNFTIHHLKDIIARGIKVANNQVEFHPSLNQKELKEFCDEQGILLTAYSPIAQGADLKLPTIQEIAKAHNRSESEVILSWLMQKNMVAIPKGSNREHIVDNFNSTTLELTREEMERIDNLNTDNRLIVPEWAEFDY